MKRWIAQQRVHPALMAGIFAMLALVFLTSSSMNLNAQSGSWTARYWNNRTLSGDPVLVRSEGSINYDWGAGSPAPEVQVDNFSAEWTQTVNIPAGTYRFTITTDDGMRVFVDNTVVIESWFDSQVRTVTADVFLGAGDHAIKVQYYEAGGVAVAKFNMSLISGQPAPPSTAWLGEYFNNTNLAGTPVMVRNDQNINFNWGFGSPDVVVQSDNFSVRWSRTLNLDAGRYRFTTVTDDGVRLSVNGVRVLDKWQVQAVTAYTVEVDIPGGNTPVVMDYFEAQGLAEARLTWTKVSGTTPPPPPPPPATGNWHAEYFGNTTLSGAPLLTRSEQSINYDWGFGSPAPQVPVDNFSARWTTSVNLPAGRYLFNVSSDDGMRVFVNDTVVIDAWFDRAVASFTAEKDLSGPTTIRVEYYERTGLAVARFSYSLISGPGGGSGGQFPGTATVTAHTLNVRSGPATSFSIIGKLNNGAVVPLTGYRNGDGSWVQIVMTNGTAGWVSATFIRSTVPIGNLIPITGTTPPPPAGGNPAGVVMAYWLNVRTGPNVGFPVITTLPGGTGVALIGRDASSTWLKIIIPDGRQGWVNGYYIDTNVPIATLPVLSN